MPNKLKFQELRYIIYRNVFLFTNGIIFAVVVLLLIFGATQAGIFLGIVSLLNIALGLFQDIHAWLALEKLQLLTAPHVSRIKADGSAETILVAQIIKGDHIALKIGDQIPCDSTVIDTTGLEVNEGLITGESSSLLKNKGEKLLAGSIVTAGGAVIQIDTVFEDSRIARMTEGIKRYSVNTSPIQHSVSTVIKYSGYILVPVLLFAIARGYFVHEPLIRIILNVGALASIIVPQGLIFAVTLFYSYGAAHFYRRNVLLQEVNATEKLGRIKNLCMDKTGTLTENSMAVENIHVSPSFTKEESEKLVSAYMQGTSDSSQVIEAIKKYINKAPEEKVDEVIPFSSGRQYGAVSVEGGGATSIVLAGSPDIFMPRIKDANAQKWLQDLTDKYSKEGKHVFCIASVKQTTIPRDLGDVEIAPVAIFVFFNNLRKGIRETIDFFQNRGVNIRIISGDNPETVRSVSLLSGVKNTDKIITGLEMAKWSDADFSEKVKSYFLFARILPEQKEKIIDSLKKDGFTAMVGDGANDALSIKKADLGIAMFDGASATRQVASIVLTNNSFTALPAGVELADTIIKNIEIFASMFLNQAIFGFLFFIILSIFGREYPVTPLNVTFINYFIIGIPGLLISYWTIRPSGKIYPATNTEAFLKRVMPYAFWSAVIQSLGLAIVYMLSPDYLKLGESNTLVFLAFITFGFSFFIWTPYVFRGSITGKEKIQMLGLIVFELALLFGSFYSAFLMSFFDITRLALSMADIVKFSSVICIFAFIQYLIARKLSMKE